jgi:DNA mismatch endonuclease, patch repair protein
MDNISKDARSHTMRSVHSKGNLSTEIKLIRIFRKLHYIGWRRSSKLTGKPDFIFPQKRIAVFADGCYWHGHNCRGLTARTNEGYWSKKIERNRSRDREVTQALSALGWKVIRLWECEIAETAVRQKLSVVESL